MQIPETCARQKRPTARFHKIITQWVLFVKRLTEIFGFLRLFIYQSRTKRQEIIKNKQTRDTLTATLPSSAGLLPRKNANIKANEKRLDKFGKITYNVRAEPRGAGGTKMKNLFKTVFFISLVAFLLIAVIIAVPSLSFTADRSASMGIIGGADGPTAIFVSGALFFGNPLFRLLCVAVIFLISAAIGWAVTRRK